MNYALGKQLILHLRLYKSFLQMQMMFRAIKCICAYVYTHISVFRKMLALVIAYILKSINRMDRKRKGYDGQNVVIPME